MEDKIITQKEKDTLPCVFCGDMYKDHADQKDPRFTAKTPCLLIKSGYFPRRVQQKIETGDIGELQMPSMTTRQFSEYTHKVEKETVAMVISKLEEILQDKTTPGLIEAIVEDLKDAIYDL